MNRNIKIKWNLNIFNIIIYLSILSISIFPIFGNFGMLFQKICIWLCICIGMFIYLHERYILINKFLVGYAIFIIFSIFSILWSIDYGGAYIRIADMGKSFLWMLILTNYANNDKKIEKLLCLYSWGVVLISVYSFILDFSSLSDWSRLGKNIFENAGQNQIYYSCILIYAINIMIYRIFASKKKKIYILASLFLYCCGLLTAIKKCMVIPLVFIFIFLFFRYKNRVLKLLISFLVMIFILIIICYLVWKYVPSMYSRIMALVEDYINGIIGDPLGNSFSQRKWLRQEAWRLFKLNPIVGVGIGQFRFYAATYGVDLYAHNNFLEILANTGLIGFIIYYGNIINMAFSSFMTSIKSKYTKSIFDILIISFLLAMFVMEYGQVDYYQSYLIFFLALFGNKVSKKHFLITLGKKM